MEREPLTRDRVVAVALRLLDEDGLEKLTLRRIATALEVRAPALYWHVANKRALLDYLTDAMLARSVAALRPPTADEPWPEWLHRAAAALRRCLLRHRDGARVASGADLTRAVALAEWLKRTVNVLCDAGFDRHDALVAGGALMSLVIGRTAEEQALPAGGMIETGRRQSADARARQAVGIMITGLRTILHESGSAR
ncbi:TetR/AcrR family transcriptional regulator C-terminal domain-containing protein [Fodinicola acaciae]|uniref:TetR/AcrR family transcriptional regulator C-terminal domain-containing protein n=1 Tax=Fodinicola acaciae TaxID=2681555 RepID=UPI001C9E2058|nr:TetR/AcrR family transcriptional regulator C-terminal domain-containing protein [Fodinicola acaciae]